MLGIYARQSVYDSKGTKESSVVDQIGQGKAKAKELGLDFKIYQDINESAAYDTLQNRPSFMKMIGDIQAGIITAVFVYDQSRLSRNQTTTLYIKKLFAEHKILVYTILDGTINYEDTDSEFMADIRTLFASKFVKDTSKKIKDKLKLNVENGKVGGGLFKAYGYMKGPDKMLVIDPEEEPIVKEIYQLYLSGLGTDRIAKHLNDKRIPTKSSKVLKNGGLHIKDKYSNEIKVIPNDKILWAGPTVMAIIKNPIYMGKRRFNDKFYTAPAIINEMTWNKAQEQKTQNHNKGGKPVHQYLLNDLLFCSRCGCGYKGKTRPNKRDHFYYCVSRNNAVGSCGNRSINIDYMNSLVWELVTDSDTITKLAKEEVEKLKNPNHIKDLEKKKKSLENQINLERVAKTKTLEMLKRGVLSDDEAEIDMKANNEKIAQLLTEVDAVASILNNQTKTLAILDEVSEAQKQINKIKNTKDFDTQKRLVRLFIERIIINFDDQLETFTLSLSIKLGLENRSKLTVPLESEFKAKNKPRVKARVEKVSFGTIEMGGIISPLVQQDQGCSVIEQGTYLRLNMKMYVYSKNGSIHKKKWLDKKVELINIE